MLWLMSYVCQLKFSNWKYDSGSKFLSRISKIQVWRDSAYGSGESWKSKVEPEPPRARILGISAAKVDSPQLPCLAATGSCPALLVTLMSPALPFSAWGSCERRFVISTPAANRFYVIILWADSKQAMEASCHLGSCQGTSVQLPGHLLLKY